MEQKAAPPPPRVTASSQVGGTQICHLGIRPQVSDPQGRGGKGAEERSAAEKTQVNHSAAPSPLCMGPSSISQCGSSFHGAHVPARGHLPALSPPVPTPVGLRVGSYRPQFRGPYQQDQTCANAAVAGWLPRLGFGESYSSCC